MPDANTCVVDLNRGRLKLECRAGMTVFAALRTHKIYLPTGCGAKGQCGQCHVRLLSGDVNPPTENEIRLVSELDRSAGMRLGCQMRLSGDIGIEVQESVFHARQYKAKIASITPLTHDIRRFSFSLEDGETIPHQAGQFINLMARIPGEKVQAVRCFSFATPASVVDHIDAIIRRTPNGAMTRHLFETAAEGDEVTIFAPFGEFHLRDSDKPCIWIAGGSGLSPFLGMLQDMIDKGIANRPVHLFFGAVNPSDLYYVELFRETAAKNPWFKYTPALSGNVQCPECIDYGLITDVVAKRVDSAEGCEGYLCGSPGMVGACIKVLTGKGMCREDIFFDRF